MGNTVPSLIASVARIALVAIPGLIVSRLPGFELRWLWWLSVASVLVQLVLAMLLLRREFAVRLGWGSPLRGRASGAPAFGRGTVPPSRFPKHRSALLPGARPPR